jgi:hypothetical protein
MSAAVSVAGRDLRLNGMGVRREKVFFKPYVIALYLEELTTDARVAIQTDQAKHIVITMLRDVSRKRFVEAMEAGIMRNSKPAMSTLRILPGGGLSQIQQHQPADLPRAARWRLFGVQFSVSPPSGAHLVNGFWSACVVHRFKDNSTS